MSASDEIAAALSATDQALRAMRDGHNELAKLRSGRVAKDNGTATLTKMTGLLETIRDRLVILDASDRAHPYHRSIQ